MKIRSGTLQDIPQMQKVFAQSISISCAKDYTLPQLEAWRNRALANPERWEKLVSENEVFILEKESEMGGFATLNSSGLIDMFYLHPAFQGQGLAQKLYQELERSATLANIPLLHSHVSLTARPFFEKMGFTLLEKQSVFIQGVELHNFRMHKSLDQP